MTQACCILVSSICNVPYILAATINLRDLILEEIGVDIHKHTRETLFPERAEVALSPMTVRSATPPRPATATDDNALSMEEYEAIVASHQRDLDMIQDRYE